MLTSSLRSLDRTRAPGGEGEREGGGGGRRSQTCRGGGAVDQRVGGGLALLRARRGGARGRLVKGVGALVEADLGRGAWASHLHWELAGAGRSGHCKGERRVFRVMK